MASVNAGQVLSIGADSCRAAVTHRWCSPSRRSIIAIRGPASVRITRGAVCAGCVTPPRTLFPCDAIDCRRSRRLQLYRQGRPPARARAARHSADARLHGSALRLECLLGRPPLQRVAPDRGRDGSSWPPRECTTMANCDFTHSARTPVRRAVRQERRTVGAIVSTKPNASDSLPRVWQAQSRPDLAHPQTSLRHVAVPGACLLRTSWLWSDAGRERPPPRMINAPARFASEMSVS